MILPILETIFLLLLPLILILMVIVTYMKRVGIYLKIGFSGREVGLLVLGPFASMLFDLPVFIYEDYFLAINIGGALIPLVLSIYLIKKLYMSLTKVIVGIALVSIATFFVTRVTDIGVVSSFPFYLFPSILAFLLSLLLFSSRSEKAPGYGYAITTFGVIIGGDIFHLPEIFKEPFTGSLGGAGLYDMVYIAGLLSFCIVLLFTRKKIKAFSFPMKGRMHSDDLYDMDEREAILLLVEEIKEKARDTGRVYGVNAFPPILLKSFIGEHACKDYGIMKRKAKGNPSKGDVKKACITAHAIIAALEKKEKSIYASAAERCAAFLLDFLIVSGIAFLLSFLFYMKLFPSFLLFLFSVQFVYFTLLEYFSGSTIGKMIIGIDIKEMDMRRTEFITSFTRNAIRFLDMALGFYFISLLLIKFSPKKQRLGDLIAGSVVVKNM